MASQWHQSKLVRVGAVLLALLLVVLLALPYLLDIDRYRPAITDALKKQTGREVEIESLRLHFLPSLRVSVSNVRLKNPKGFPDGDTVTIGSIDVGLAFRPLLSGHVEITSVTLGAIEVNLLTDARGRTNYASLLNPPRSSRRKAAAAEEETSWSLARVDSVALEDITITSGTFRRRNKRVYPMWAATGINVRAQGFDFTSNNWREKMTARIDLTPIEFTSPSLKEPLRFTDGEVEVKGNAARGNLTAALGPLRAQGSVRMANLAKPVAVFTLSMKELDVASFRQVLGPGPEGAPKPPGGRSGQGLLARGTVKVGRVIVSPLSAEKVDAKVRIYADRLEVNPFSFSFYRGAAKGTLGVKLDDQALPARVNATVQGVEVARLMAAASPDAKDTITGTFEAVVRLGASLGAQDLVSALSGQGTFAVREGTFPGLDVESALAKAAKFMAMDVPAGDTKFSFFGGDFNIADGRVGSKRLRLLGEALEADLRGSFGFDQTLDYGGTGVVKASGTQEQASSGNPLDAVGRLFGRTVQQRLNFTSLRVPFRVRGTFQEPTFLVTGPPTPLR